MSKIRLLDCTLRDGAYIVDGNFGSGTIKGLIKRLYEAHIDIIECGWLKDIEHKEGSSYYHVPSDLLRYMPKAKSEDALYVAMIDYNRYNLDFLPQNDGKSIDAIRIVFPKQHIDDGLALVEPIRKKGYKVFLQAANTFGYSDAELMNLAYKVNEVKPEALSIVDTFGSMYERDLKRIIYILDNNLLKEIDLGFHSHNNQQQSFSLSMKFIEEIKTIGGRNAIVDSSLCGMGRGAGNTPTELISSYLNKIYSKQYDMNIIMDAIDMYMTYFINNYTWGYSIPYMISGYYGCHVNNVKYLTKTHRTLNKDMRNIFESMEINDRTQYNYDLLEKCYMEYQEKEVDDSDDKEIISKALANNKIGMILPGISTKKDQVKVLKTIEDNGLTTIGINAIVEGYTYDYAFFSNPLKYEIAQDMFGDVLSNTKVILTSNIKTSSKRELIINYNSIIKHNWKYYDNSAILFLRFLRSIGAFDVYIAGFDGFISDGKYADETLNANFDEKERKNMQYDVEDMYSDFAKSNDRLTIKFITESPFAKYSC